MPDHLSGDATRRRRRADLHVLIPLDLPMMGRFSACRNGKQRVSRMTMAAAESALVKDPVCGMAVAPASPPHRAGHGGPPYHFCSAGCRDKFVAEPARFLAASTRTPP